MGKFNEYSQKATPEDNDTLMIYDATGTANKLSPFSGIWNWIVGKLTNAVISKLKTNNQTVLGAINELYSKNARETITGTTTLEEYCVTNGKLPGEYKINGAIVSGISTSKIWAVLILSASFDSQILISSDTSVYIRTRTGTPAAWREWKKFTGTTLS